MPTPLALIVLDGWGYRPEKSHNAIASAQTPFLDSLYAQYPHALLQAAGQAVGLPYGQIGNSEVGHITIGAGRVIDTDLVRINKAVASNTLAQNPALTKLFAHVREQNSALHIQGLVSPGGIHSHQAHLHAIIKAARASGVNTIIVHAFTDGRDTPPHSAAKFLEELEREIKKHEGVHIGTLMGRYYAMDRDNNWDRIQKAEEALFSGQGEVIADKNPSQVLAQMYEEHQAHDEHIMPLVFLQPGGELPHIKEHDGVLFFNFRSDRARQLSKKILERAKKLDVCFATMTEYDPELAVLVAFPPERGHTCLAAEVSRAGLAQTHIAETEKYAHATYFLNGGREKPFANERHILIESRNDVATHDAAPEMRAQEITNAALTEVDKGTPFIFINYANADMVGHTAHFKATVTAVETVDSQLARLVPAVLAKGGAVFITADHGNAEIVYDEEDNVKHTAHTTNPVPAILTVDGAHLRAGALSDVAPTILNLLNLPVPAAMTGKSLF